MPYLDMTLLNDMIRLQFDQQQQDLFATPL
jgi:hypothetical protein